MEVSFVGMIDVPFTDGFDFSAGVPVARRINGLGELFKRRNDSAQKFELVILLKPIIIDANGKVWNRVMRKDANRMRAMNGDFSYRSNVGLNN